VIRGTSKIDAITIGTLNANFLAGPGAISLETKVAFVNSKTGQTHGWTDYKGPWSPAVTAKLKELAEVMEKEIGALHFADTDDISTSRPSEATGGLGEFVSSGDGSQV
jgi:hypothetical protein